MTVLRAFAAVWLAGAALTLQDHTRRVYVTATLRVGHDAYEATRALPLPTPEQRRYLEAAGPRIERGGGCNDARQMLPEVQIPQQ